MSWIDDLEERTRVRKELPLHTGEIRNALDRVKADMTSGLSPETLERLSECLTQLDEVSAMLDEYAAQEEGDQSPVRE